MAGSLTATSTSTQRAPGNAVQSTNMRAQTYRQRGYGTISYSEADTGRQRFDEDLWVVGQKA